MVESLLALERTTRSFFEPTPIGEHGQRGLLWAIILSHIICLVHGGEIKGIQGGCRVKTVVTLLIQGGYRVNKRWIQGQGGYYIGIGWI